MNAKKDIDYGNKKELTKEELEKVEGGALAPHKKKRPSEENRKTIKRDDNLNSGPVPVWDK